jgi:hypothetical protein
MFPSIHDTQVVAYSADSRSARVELVLRAGPQDDAPLSRLVFAGVAAHQFEHPLMPSWVFDLEEIAADTLLEREWDNFREGHRLSGWPGNWAESLTQAKAFCTQQGLRGFDLESSYGFDGWVLAQSVELIGGV